jgi:Fe-S oxidoreductase
MVDSALVRDIGRRRLQRALGTGARTIVSACQQCKWTITATAKAEDLPSG